MSDIFQHPPRFLTAADPEAAAAALIEWMRTELDLTQPQTWLLSGGSTPKPLYRQLASSGLDLSNLTFFLTDERIVPKAHNACNYKLLTDHFHAGIAEAARRPDICVFYDVEEDRATNDLMLRQQLDRLPPVTFALLGIGTDGHTASLFPHKPQNFATGDWLYATYESGDGLERVSLNYPYLLRAERIAVLCTEDKKADILERVCRAPYDPVALPVQHVFRHYDRPILLVGDEAAWGRARRTVGQSNDGDN